MTKVNLTWYFTDGSCISGEESEGYLRRKVQLFNSVSTRISESLLKISDYNNLQDSGDVYEDVLENGEYLSWIQLELKELLHAVSSVLED